MYFNGTSYVVFFKSENIYDIILERRNISIRITQQIVLLRSACRKRSPQGGLFLVLSLNMQ